MSQPPPPPPPPPSSAAPPPPPPPPPAPARGRRWRRRTSGGAAGQGGRWRWWRLGRGPGQARASGAPGERQTGRRRLDPARLWRALSRLAPWLVATARRLCTQGAQVARTRLLAPLADLARRCEQVAVLGPVVRFASSVLGAVTPLGWGSLVVMALSWWAGATRHWLEAWTLATALTLLLVVALLWSLGRTSYQVTVSLASTRVTVGEPALGNVVLRGAAGRAVGSSTIEMPVGRGLAVFRVPRLGAGQTHEEVFTVPTRRRGLVTVGPVTSVRGDALGLVRRTQRWTDPLDLYIHPRTTALDTTALGFIRDIEGAVTQDLSSSDVSFHALRDYVPGDDRRNVHWRTTARVGRLMVRQFEETRRAHLLLVLDLDPASWAGDEDFETAVSVTASLALTALREHRELSLVTQAGVPLLPTSTRVLDLLTTIERLADRGDLMEVTRCAAAAVPDASVTVLVTGSLVPIASIHRAHVELPLSTRSIALRVDGDAALRSQRLAGLPVLTLPELDLLGRAMRKVDS